MSGGQQNKDEEIAPWQLPQFCSLCEVKMVARMTELKEKQVGVSAARLNEVPARSRAARRRRRTPRRSRDWAARRCPRGLQEEDAAQC